LRNAASCEGFRCLLICTALLFATNIHYLFAQKLVHYATPPDAKRGEVVYKAGCIACHGADGTGADPASTVFVRPHTFPDLTRCDQTTSEPDSSYKAVILHGGHGLGFSQIMPAFGDLLTDQQINDVIAYIRTFCHNTGHYPAGELNLPRALITEKAFPEDELVLSTAATAGSPASWTTDVIHEQTLAGLNQIEIDVPINYAVLNNQGNTQTSQANPPNSNWTAGFGDITVGLKRTLFSSLRAGSILSAQVGFLLPTGDSSRGFGADTTTFEPFLAYDQLLGERNFLQFQLGGDVTFDSAKSPRSLFFRTAAGRSMAPDHGLGRLFTPMVEFVGTHDYSPGAGTDLDIVPQMQVTVSKRQHIRADLGVSAPVANTADRKPQIIFYVLWDWAEGAFWNGWR
jgi:mono/diheme cytochrome c family protein